MSSTALLPILVVLLLSFSGGDVVATGHKHNKRITIDGPLLSSKLQANKTLIVDLSGKEDFTSVQKAIDAVPEGNSDWIIIHVRKGVYREKIVIPENKPYIFLRGNGKGRSHIVWDKSSDSNTASSTFTVFANNIIAFGISFKNDAPTGEAGTTYNKSVAAMVGGDKAAFYHCAFYSTHNTLFDYKGRHYYESCYIQGSLDFIFGRGQSTFQSCEIFVVGDKRQSILGSITAQNRQSEDDNSGFVFLKAKVYGIGDVYLGRAKGPHSRVIFHDAYISRTIAPEGWTSWSYDGTLEKLFYGEHKCHGPGASSSQRVSWARQLTEDEVAPFTDIGFINGDEWLPAYYHHI